MGDIGPQIVSFGVIRPVDPVGIAMKRHTDNTSTPTPRREQKRPGQIALEAALGLPLMLVVLLGTLDVGQAAIDYFTLRGACRDAALYASSDPTDTAGIIEQGYTYSQALDSENTRFTVETRGEGANTRLIVRAERTFEPVTLRVIGNLIGIEDVTLIAQASTGVEQGQ